MADAATGAPQIQGTLPLYKRPEPLNVQTHKGLGLKFGDRPFDFLNEAHFVPLTAGEFSIASGHYPVIFLGDARMPVAVMGLQPGMNLFVDQATGMLEPHIYIPAFVRRYPFVSAVHTEEKDRFTVCVDAGSHLISDKPDQPFFDENGELTAFSQQAVDFVRRYESEVAGTHELIDELRKLDLFEEQKTHYMPRDGSGQPLGEPVVIATYWGISPEKFRALPAETLAKLRDNTILSAIYAHIMSQSRWENIMSRVNARQSGSQPQQPQPGVAPAPPEA